MNDLVIMKNKQAVTSSLQVAKTFEKNHRDVLRAIVNLEIGSAKLRSQMFAEGTYSNRRPTWEELIEFNRKHHYRWE